jgi:hypothetical protein
LAVIISAPLIAWAMGAALILGAASPALAQEHRDDRNRYDGGRHGVSRHDGGRHQDFRRDEGRRDIRLAQEHGHDRDWRANSWRHIRRDEGWRDRDSHRFDDHDFDRWRGGHWFHGQHEGRLGWWWLAGANWYYYPQPIYPYPDPYVPPYAAPGDGAWYYCPPTRSFYPYVSGCPVPWQIVPAR